MKVHVLDAFIAGKGLLRAAMLGLFTVADMGGGGEMARGEFMRFFAETPWYPTALLPSQGVQWAAVDGSSAHASISDGGLMSAFGVLHLAHAGAGPHRTSQAARAGYTKAIRALVTPRGKAAMTAGRPVPHPGSPDRSRMPS